MYVPPEPEKMKVIIWGKELCNGAEWYDFLKCVEEKTRENDQLKQQLAEKDKEIKKLNWQLKDKDFIIKNLNHSLSVAPNANAGQRARIDELTKIVKEKDKEIERLHETISNKVTSAYGADLMAKSIQFFLKKENHELKQHQTKLAIQELEKVKEYNAQRIYGNDLVNKFIDKRISALKGEKEVED